MVLTATDFEEWFRSLLDAQREAVDERRRLLVEQAADCNGIASVMGVKTDYLVNGDEAYRPGQPGYIVVTSSPMVLFVDDDGGYVARGASPHAVGQRGDQ
jgi:hypothetical protein